MLRLVVGQMHPKGLRMAEKKTVREWRQERQNQRLGIGQPTTPPEQDNGGGVIGDTLRGVGAGLATTAQGLTGLTALAPLPEGAQDVALAPSRFFGGIAENLRKGQSQAAQTARQNVEGAWQEGEGFFDNVGSTLGAIAENPRYLVLAGSEALGTIGGIGAGARVVGKIAPRLLNTTARRVGTAEGAMVGGLSASEIAEGRPDEYAPRLYGAAAGAASGVLGGLGSRLGGRLDPETLVESMFRSGAREGRRSAPRAALAETSGVVGRAATGAGIEATQEGLQEGIEAGFTNLGLDRPITEGMGQAFTLGAVTGGVAGAPFGALHGPAVQRARARDQDAFRKVAAFIGARKAAENASANPFAEADKLVREGFERIGTLRQGREGLQQFMDAFGVTENGRPAFYRALADMSASRFPQVRQAGRRVLSIATGMPEAQLPRMARPNSLNPVNNALSRLDSRIEALDRQIKSVGEGNVDQRREWQRELTQAQERRDALQATREAFAPAIEANIEQRRQERRARALQRDMFEEADANARAQDQMLRDQLERQAREPGQSAVDPLRQQQELFPERRDPAVAPEATVGPDGQVDAFGPQIAPPPEPIAQPTPPLEGQGELFPQTDAAPTQEQIPAPAAGVQPETGQLEMFEGSQAQQLPLDLAAPEQDAGVAPQQLPVEPERLRNRDQFVDETLNRAVENIAQADMSQILELSGEGDITLPQIARIANVPLARLRRATRQELTRARGDSRGSPIEQLTRAIRQRQTEALVEQQSAIDYLAEQVSNDVPLGRAISRAPAAVKRVFPRVKDMPPDIRQNLEALRPPKTQGSAGQAEPAGPRPRARLSSQTPLNTLAPAQIMRHVDEVTRGWQNKPEVTLIENLQSQDLAPEVRDVANDIAARVELIGRSPAAFFYNGQVYIIQEQMATLEDVTKAVYHEMVGHYGLRGVVGSEFNLNEVLDMLVEERELDVAFFASKYNLDMNDTKQRREAAEEMIAHLAEEMSSMGFWQQLMSRIRAFLDSIALDGRKMTDDQIIQDFLRPARNFVARRDFAGLNTANPDVIRLQVANPASTPRPNNEIIDQYGVDVEDKQDLLEKTGELCRRTKSSLMFTMTLMRQIATRAPSTNNLRTAWREAQRIAAHWERRQSMLGETINKLKYAQQQRVTDVLVHYTTNQTMPFIPNNAVQMEYDQQTDALRAVPLSEVEGIQEKVDSSMYDNLPEREKEVVRLTLETTAEVLAARTQMEFDKVRESRDLLAEQQQPDSQVQDAYLKAVDSLVTIHNNRAASAYVPTYRLGNYTVEAKSAEYQQAEMDADQSGDLSSLRAMRARGTDGEPTHYFFGRYDSYKAAQQAKQQLLDRGFADVETKTPTKGRPEFKLEYASIVRLLKAQEEAANEKDLSRAERSMQRLSEGMRAAVRGVLLEVAEANSETASQMDRQGVEGINRTHVLRNTLDYVKHFGFAIASAQTTSDRMAAIAGMRSELRQLTDEDSRKYVGYFNKLIDRLETPYDNKEGLVESGARGVLAVSPFWYLLTNPSYYVLQLTQTWLMTAPVLAGEFGPASAWGAVAKSYTDIKPVIEAALRGNTEINFEGMPEGKRKMLLELQARNVLDVGISHEFGGWGQGVAGRVMQRLYNYARRVELVNRVSAASAAYDLRMNKLTKGKPLGSFSAEQRKQFQDQATDFADHIVYTTHGDYSYSNAPQAFKRPPMRAILQFKKIALIQAELLYEHAKQGWAKPKLSKRAMDLLSRDDVAIDPQILAKLQERQRITEAEFTQLHREVLAASRDTATQLSPRDVTFLNQMLGSELNPETFVTLERAIASKKAFAWLIGTAGAISGTISVPFATTIFAMLAKQLGDEEDDELDSAPEDTINRIFGPELGTFITRGAMGAIGLDVSHRIGINMVEQTFGSVYNNFSFADPQTGAKEAMVGLLGPPASLVADTFKGYGYLSDYATTGSNHDLAKGLASMAPLGIRNAIIAGLYNEEGLVNDSRVTLIPREEFLGREIAGKFLGFNPTRVSEFYAMRQQFDEVENAVNRKRLLIKRSYYEAVEAGDTRRINNAIDQWKQLQKDQRDVNLAPSPIAELRQFVVRKRREEQQQVAGLTTTSKNRRLAEIVARIHQQPTLLEEYDITGEL